MSILIKGMEMPSCEVGYRAYMDFRIWNDGTVEARIGPKETEYKAVPVPPHGRLIDADAAIEVWEVKLSDGDSCSFRNIETTVSKFLLSHLMGEVPPTIIPAEEGET